MAPFCLSAVLQSADYALAPAPLTRVSVTDTFWAPKIDANRRITIPHILAENDRTGRVENFRKAAHVVDGAYIEDRGRTAIQRGPIVYCFEAVDNGGHVLDRTLPRDATLSQRFDAALLGGVEEVRAGNLTAIPYYAWNNRGRGEMAVWMPH